MKPGQWRRSVAGKYLRHLPRIKHIKGTWLHRRVGDRLFAKELWQPERHTFALGTALGVFFGLIPLPIQMLGAALSAFFTRSNIPVAIAATWFTNPFTAPFLIYLQYKVGMFLTGYGTNREPAQGIIEILKQAPVPFFIGAVVVGIIFSLLSYPLMLLGWDLVHKYFMKRIPHAERMAKRKKPSPSTIQK